MNQCGTVLALVLVLVIIINQKNTNTSTNTKHMSPFFQKITPNSLILTANSRLSLYLQSLFNQYQQELNHRVWITPTIIPLQNWLQKQFYQYNTSEKLLLTDFQELCVWEDIILQTSISPLIQPGEMAKLVKQAFSYLTLWRVPIESLEPYKDQLEVSSLMEWIEKFRLHCLDKNWITEAQLPQWINEYNENKTLSSPSTIMLVGFDDLNPSLENLFSALKKRMQVKTEILSAKVSSKKHIILEDTETELIAMAKWAKAQWSANPNTQIGCVIPDLGNLRIEVRRIFTEIFCIENNLPGIVTSLPPFNLSAGTVISAHKMIDTAFQLLKWSRESLSIENISLLLQSPYVCMNDEEINLGAKIDALLREQNYLYVNIIDLFSIIPKFQSHYSDSNLLTRLRDFLALDETNKTAMLKASQWAEHFMLKLKAIGWPSSHSQTSDEFQCLEKFKKLLFEFSQCDVIYSNMTEKRALHLLTRLAEQTLFQPKSHHEPIQIMGALEASSILFDSVWIMGLHNGIWPPPAKPHPLIPFSIQQTYQMPHATGKRELQFCEQLTKRLENSANEVIFSSPKKCGDQILSPTTLIEHIPIVDSIELGFLQHPYSEKIFLSRKIETIDDFKAHPLTHFSHIRGGSTILKLQALCPFRAFATIRLAALKLNTPTLGIPSFKKGILIHQILFDIWDVLKDQNGLNALSEEELDTLIENSIHQCVSDETHYFYSIEKKRLQILIKEWLNFEKTRPYFSVIEKESSYQMTVNQLPINIRLDRVDQLSDGSLFLIDYKTGMSSVNAWFSERITDPQLPLYVAFHNQIETYKGMSFGEIKNGEMRFKGIIHEAHIYGDSVKGLTPIHFIKNEIEMTSWDALKNFWKTALTRLSNEFCEGVANVQPMTKVVCDTCDLKAVCRVRDEG